MNRFLYIFLIVLGQVTLLTSCSDKDVLRPDPEVPAEGITSLSAEIYGMSGAEEWTGREQIGVYGSAKGENAHYQVRQSFVGTEGEASFFGSAVDGELIAYYPYLAGGYRCVAEGCVPLPYTQRYCSGAASQLESHSVMVAAGQNGKFTFKHHCGVVKFTVSAQYGGQVKSLVLSSPSDTLCGNMLLVSATAKFAEGSKTLELYGMNKPQGAFDAWFMLPEGKYAGLGLTIVTDSDRFTKPVTGVLPIYAAKESVTVVKDESYEYENSDFIVIDGRFDR